LIAAIVVLAFVTAERVAELALARRNTARLLARGAKEYAPSHFRLIVALHVAWLAGLWLLGWNRPIEWGWLAVFAMLQVLRVWVLATLGARWTTRIIVLPGAPLVKTGPYRFLNHPNYVVVIGEIAVLPLALGLPLYALGFSILNGVALWIRISAENSALRGASDLTV
jgi:methyltransferase